MAVSCGLVGLPNVGKSTLFNLLMRQEVVAAENFPFCTIDPQDGQAVVPDERLPHIARHAGTKVVVAATLQVTDIAGLIRGASKGEGLGSAFLQHIRAVDAIIHVVRFFQDDDIIHVDGSVDPVRDCQVIDTEIILADLTFLEKRFDSMRKQRFTKEVAVKKELEFLEAGQAFLLEGRPIREMEVEGEALDSPSYKGLLSVKPVLYACNVDLDQMGDFYTLPQTKALQGYVGEQSQLLPICVQFEKELASLQDAEERNAFLEDVGIKEEAFSRLVRGAYGLLGQISFFTAGEKEVRAWTVHEGASAQQAAGKIHTDIARGFIVAEVVSYSDFCQYGGWAGARQVGKVRQEGRDYRVQDGDIIHFRFNV